MYYWKYDGKLPAIECDVWLDNNEFYCCIMDEMVSNFEASLLGVAFQPDLMKRADSFDC